jgi:hypothetical protein
MAALTGLAHREAERRVCEPQISRIDAGCARYLLGRVALDEALVSLEQPLAWQQREAILLDGSAQLTNPAPVVQQLSKELLPRRPRRALHAIEKTFRREVNLTRHAPKAK